MKASRPNDGRRKLKLLLANDFWTLDQESRDVYAKASTDTEKRAELVSTLEQIDDDQDEHDYTPGMGIIVRTDYSDDEAWNAFVTVVKDAEKDLISPEATTVSGAGPSTAEGTSAGDDSESDSDGDGDVEGGSGDSSPSTELFTFINPTLSEQRERLTGISNLKALRLFNDIDIAIVPVRSPDTQRIKPGNRIMDLNGFLEVYTGDLVWVYDAQSNRDRSVRLVNQKCETYGAATYVVLFGILDICQ